MVKNILLTTLTLILLCTTFAAAATVYPTTSKNVQPLSYNSDDYYMNDYENRGDEYYIRPLKSARDSYYQTTTYADYYTNPCNMFRKNDFVHRYRPACTNCNECGYC